MPSTHKNHIPGLDGIRALAVLLVYIEHKVLLNFTLGALGVNIFFCLSGFLIIGILHQQRARIELGVADFRSELAQFWEKRVRWIFPVYHLTVVVLIGIAVWQGRSVTNDGLVPWYVLMSPNVYIGMISREWNHFTHLWSIGVEQHFYMLISPTLLLVPAILHRRVLVALFIGSMGAMWVQYLLSEHQRSIYVSSLGNFFFMAAGGLFALRDEATEKRSGVADLVICAVATAALIVIMKTPLRHTLDGGMARVLFSSLGLVIGMTMLRFVVTQHASRIVHLLELAPVRYIGTLSYGFYVYHVLIPSLPEPFPGPMGKLISIAIHFTTCIALSAASWHWMERRLLRRATAASSGVNQVAA